MVSSYGREGLGREGGREGRLVVAVFLEGGMFWVLVCWLFCLPWMVLVYCLGLWA